MRLSRLLIALLLMLLGLVPVAAQAQQSAPAASPPAFDSSPLLHGQVPPMNPKALNLPTAPNVRTFVLPRGAVLSPGTKMAMNDERCYAIRDYRFSRVAPGSDATKLSGSSTCEPASQVHLKSAGAAALPNVHAQPSIERCGFGYGNVCPAYPRGGAAPAH